MASEEERRAEVMAEEIFDLVWELIHDDLKYSHLLGDIRAIIRNGMGFNAP